MPFTPVHLGPGAAFKAIGGRHFSFLIFGGSQVLMDIEPLVAIIRGWPVLHGLTHTLLGAFVIGSVAVIVGKPISELLLRSLRIPHHPLTWSVAVGSAAIGTFSHVIPDAVMHRDMRPWWPFTDENVLLNCVSVGWLHALCLAAGILGAVGISLLGADNR